MTQHARTAKTSAADKRSKGTVPPAGSAGPQKRKTTNGGTSPRNGSRGFEKKTIALVYDFDGTLSPRPMQEYAFLPKIGVDAKAFWKESNKRALAEGADPMITYMHLLYQKAKAAGIRIDREDLVAQGAQVELFEGVAAWFDAIEDYVRLRAESQGIQLKHYLISSGLAEIVEGTPIYDRFDNVFASEYWFDAYDLPYPKRVITDTGKTQYLFRINKGIENPSDTINQHMDEAERPVPFSNMIYFGDGDTDVPSMAVMRKNGGYAVAVYPPGKPKKKCVDLFRAGRIDFFAPADYSRGSDLFQRTCLLLDRILADIRINEEVWKLDKAARR